MTPAPSVRNLSRGGVHHATGRKYPGNICRNCGLGGHLIGACRFPAISLGVICFRANVSTGELEYLMVQRRHSYNFVEFTLGKYGSAAGGEAYLTKMVAMMTARERALITAGDFAVMWRDAWDNPHGSRVNDTYNSSLSKYVDVLPRLREIIAKTPTFLEEPEWTFPKGRRKIIRVPPGALSLSASAPGPRRVSESNRTGACREFVEETGVQNSNLVLVDVPAFQEDFLGKPSGVRFRNIFFLGYLNTNDSRTSLPINRANPAQAREIRQVRWFTYRETMAHICEHNVERRALFDRIDAFLREAPPHKIYRGSHHLVASHVSVVGTGGMDMDSQTHLSRESSDSSTARQST